MCARKLSWTSLRYLPSIFLEGLRKTTISIRIFGVHTAVRTRRRPKKKNRKPYRYRHLVWASSCGAGDIVWLEEATKTESGTEEGQTGNFCQQEIRHTSYLPSDKSSITSHAVPTDFSGDSKTQTSVEHGMCVCVCVCVCVCLKAEELNVSIPVIAGHLRQFSALKWYPVVSVCWQSW